MSLVCDEVLSVRPGSLRLPLPPALFVLIYRHEYACLASSGPLAHFVSSAGLRSRKLGVPKFQGLGNVVVAWSIEAIWLLIAQKHAP